MINLISGLTEFKEMFMDQLQFSLTPRLQLDFSAINSCKPGRSRNTFKLGKKKIFEKRKRKKQKKPDYQHERR